MPRADGTRVGKYYTKRESGTKGTSWGFLLSPRLMDSNMIGLGWGPRHGHPFDPPADSNVETMLRGTDIAHVEDLVF